MIGTFRAFNLVFYLSLLAYIQVCLVNAALTFNVNSTQVYPNTTTTNSGGKSFTSHLSIFNRTETSASPSVAITITPDVMGKVPENTTTKSIQASFANLSISMTTTSRQAFMGPSSSAPGLYPTDSSIVSIQLINSGVSTSPDHTNNVLSASTAFPSGNSNMPFSSGMFIKPNQTTVLGLTKSGIMGKVPSSKLSMSPNVSTQASITARQSLGSVLPSHRPSFGANGTASISGMPSGSGLSLSANRTAINVPVILGTGVTLLSSVSTISTNNTPGISITTAGSGSTLPGSGSSISLPSTMSASMTTTASNGGEGVVGGGGGGAGGGGIGIGIGGGGIGGVGGGDGGGGGDNGNNENNNSDESISQGRQSQTETSELSSSTVTSPDSSSTASISQTTPTLTSSDYSSSITSSALNSSAMISTSARLTSSSGVLNSTLPASTASFNNATSACPSCGDCSTYDYSPEATPNPIDIDDDMMKRELVGRAYKGKRAKGNEKKTSKVASQMCAVSLYTQKPEYPGPGSIANNEPPATPVPRMAPFYATATYWAVPTQPPQRCDAPGWNFLSTENIGRAQPPWSLGGPKGKRVNTDHVYEASILDEFFLAQINTQATTCQAIQALFDVPDDENGGTRLNTVFAQLASFANPDFVGMDQDLNGLKGALWNPALRGVTPKQNPNARKQALADLAVVMSMANHIRISSRFDATNARIYQAFKGLDALIDQGKNCNPNPPQPGSSISVPDSTQSTSQDLSQSTPQSSIQETTQGPTQTTSSKLVSFISLDPFGKRDTGSVESGPAPTLISSASSIPSSTIAEPTTAPITSRNLISSSQENPITAPSTQTSAGPASATWAAAYSTWILQKIQSQNALITSLASSYSAAIPTEWASGDKLGQGEVRGFSSFIFNFNAVYKVASFTFPAPTNWPVDAINMQKSQTVNCQPTQTAGNTQPSTMAESIGSQTSASLTTMSQRTGTSVPQTATSSQPGEPQKLPQNVADQSTPVGILETFSGGPAYQAMHPDAVEGMTS